MENVLDVNLGGAGEEGEKKREKERYLEEFLENNKMTIGLFLVGVILLGLGVLGVKIFNFSSGPKVEILGSETGEVAPLRQGFAGQGSEGKITVEAAGEVIRPGVYELASGSRVNDLLTAAGGLSAEADREWVGKNINLAAKLSDGGKVFIPHVGSSTEEVLSIKNQVLRDEKININTVSESELDTLWGVGPATAKKIIEGRPYQRTEELLEKKIVKSNVWEEIKSKISVF